MGSDAMIFVFWMLSFKPTFSLSSFTFINRLFSFSFLSAIKVMSSAYLRLLLFLPEILIPACASSSPAFLPGGSDGKVSVYNSGDPVQSLGWEDPLEKEMAIHSSTIAWKIPWTEEPGRLQDRKESDRTEWLHFHSAYKLNKQSDNIQPWRSPFPIWNQSVVPCPVLTVASWPAYRFLKRQVRCSGIPICLRIFHSLLWSTQLYMNLIKRCYISHVHFSVYLHYTILIRQT